MAVREDNPNSGKLHAARMVNRPTKPGKRPVTIKRGNRSFTRSTKRKIHASRAIARQEVSAMYSAGFRVENHNVNDHGLDCYIAKNR